MKAATPMSTLVTYLAIALTLVVLDMVWLQLIARDWYQNGIGHLMAAKPSLAPAGLFYLLFPIGLMVFALKPGFAGDGVGGAAVMGALFGFFAYATYDLTNLAILKDWPLGLSIADTAWGTFVGGMSAAAGKAASHYMGQS